MATRLYVVRYYGEEYEIRAHSKEDAAERYADILGGDTDSTVFWCIDAVRAPRKRNGVRPDVDEYDWEPQNIAQHPKEPACIKRKKHKWQDGQVFGSGGGVAYTDTCCHCGLQKFTDTWATNTENHTQGHLFIEYTAG